MMTKMEIVPAKICMQRRFDIATFTDFGQHLLHKSLSLLCFVRSCSIIIIHLLQASYLKFLNVCISGVINIPLLLFLKLRHSQRLPT